VKAQLINKMMPAEMVAFDFNPMTLKMQKGTRTNHAANASPSGPKGSTPGIFRGSSPTTLNGTGHLEGDNVKSRTEQLLAWCDPGGGLLGKAMGAVMGALSDGRMNLSSKPPVLIFTWGPFLMECLVSNVIVDFKRFDSSGSPTRAEVNFTVTEEPSLLSMMPTNPTSGGLPGRKRHVVAHGETLPLIAAQNYGHPSLWRALADINRIDDPFRMEPGRVLLLPSVSELSEMRA
jgi:nucleoid-associated protein YgaU